MTSLPPACPALGTGSTLKPVYSFTVLALDCWRCGVTLPEIWQKLEELRRAKPSRFRKRQVDVIPYDDLPKEVLDAAFVNRLGLCPRCLGRIRPSDPVCP